MTDMEKTGTCKTCGINLWAETSNRPSIMPCGVKACPYETEAEQAAIEYQGERSPTGSGLAQALEMLD